MKRAKLALLFEIVSEIRRRDSGPEGKNCFHYWWAGIASLLVLCFGSSAGLAQDFGIESASLTNGSVLISFQGRSDSYYFLHGGSSLAGPLSPVSALLGNDGTQLFNSTANANSSFFRIEQIPLTSTNSLLADGIPDGWKLQHGLDPLGPSPTNMVPLGTTNTWLQIYQEDYANSILPLAYFPRIVLTNPPGATNLIIPVAFSKPFTGRMSYLLSGTAVPTTASPDGLNGDYRPPPGFVNLSSVTQAVLSINLISRSAVEVERSLVVAISAQPSNQTYRIANGSSVCSVRLSQSTLGVYLGTLSISNGLVLGSQPVKMAIRSGTNNSVEAFFDVTGNPLLGNSFSVPLTASTNGFEFAGSYSGQVTNTPFNRPLNLSLSFGPTQEASTNTLYTPVTLTVSGLTGSGHSYTGLGSLILSQSQ